MPKKISDAKRSAAEAMLREGKSVKEVSDKTKISAPTINKMRADLGLVKKRTSTKTKKVDEFQLKFRAAILARSLEENSDKDIKGWDQLVEDIQALRDNSLFQFADQCGGIDAAVKIVTEAKEVYDKEVDELKKEKAA